MDSEVQLDEIDVKILSALIRDARAKLKDIAEECGLTSNAIFKRIKHLKSAGVIVGTTVYPDAKEFGHTHIATVGINLDYAQEEELVKLILERAETNLIEIFSSIGKYDLTAFIVAKSLQELDNITQAIRKHPSVKRVAVNIWISEPYFLLENLELKPTGV
jgi:DNA-binding Lrp family transcriptional regulator